MQFIMLNYIVAVGLLLIVLYTIYNTMFYLTFHVALVSNTAVYSFMAYVVVHCDVCTQLRQRWTCLTNESTSTTTTTTQLSL